MKISNRTIIIVYIIDILFILILSVIWFTDIVFTEDQWIEGVIFQDIIIVITGSIAVIFLLYLGFLYKFKTLVGKIWLLLGIGWGFWLIGEAIYIHFELFTEIPPFPSIADIFYLTAYVPISVGLILHIWKLKIDLTLLDKLLTAIIYISICIIVIFSIIVIPIQEAFPIPSDEILEYIVVSMYPLFDLILLLCVIIIFAKFRHGKVTLTWIILCIGLLFDLTGDILFSWLETLEREEILFEPFDLFFIIGYICAFTSALTNLNLMTQAFEKTFNSPK